ncbi:helix-turn-helix transcriptional regulator [Micromonospora sp. CA-111912]|uniref:helix-turn-helix transcriptional regulator n=1 Tax=Micromonospora sp. CA-111912 TaxID=3239955 RepID=UPI003D916A80
MNARDLAAYLGLRVQTVYNWKVRGIGPARTMVGRSVRFKESDVQHWLAGQKRKDKK